MSGSQSGRFSAYIRFVAAVLYFFLARSIAHRGAMGLATDRWLPLVEAAMLVFLLLLGYGAMGRFLDRQREPVSDQGWRRRFGWPSEVGLGLATGWALAVVCVLPLTVIGGISILFNTHGPAWSDLVGDLCFFALVAAAEEIAFRGYGFQRFTAAVGPTGASLGFATLYAIVQAQIPGSNWAGFGVSLMLGLLLSLACLRTQALWLSWGLNFGWKASRALLFGLAISGVNSHSPVVQGNPMGPFWLTGGGFGLDGSWWTVLALLCFVPVVFRVTRELDFKYNAPVLIPGGIPVDLDAAARAQHEAAMSSEPAPKPLVQILPAPPVVKADVKPE